MVKNWKAALLAAGLMLALGPGWAFGADLSDFKSDANVAIGEGDEYVVTGGNQIWDKPITEGTYVGFPSDESTVANINMNGGKLTIGPDASTLGYLEAGRFVMTGGELTIQGSTAANGNWANTNSWLTGGWQNIDATETAATASVSITGGTINLKNGGRIQTTRSDVPDYPARMLHIGGDAVINITEGTGVLRATDAGANTAKKDSTTKLVIDGNAKINVSGSANAVILSRDTTMSGGTITNTGTGKLIVAGGAADAGADPAASIGNSGTSKAWGEFAMTGGTIDNSAEDAGAIDFVAGNLDLNATGGTIKTGTLNLDTTAASAKNSIAAKNLNVLEGGTFAVDGSVKLTNNGAFSNLGSLSITQELTTGTNEFTSAGNLSVGSDAVFGGKATFGGDATFGGATTSAGDFTMGENSTLHLLEDATLAVTGTLALEESTKLKVDSNTSGTTAITSTTGVTVGTNSSTGDAAAKQAVTDYLASQNASGLANSKEFTLDENGKLVVKVTEQTDSTKGMMDALNASGSGYMAPGLTASATDTLMDIATNTDLTTGQGKVIRDLVSNYLDGSATSGAEVQSVTSALAGLDSAKSLDIAMLTANNVAGRIQSRVADNNLARANADSQFGSGSALASYALNNSFANRFWFGGFGLWEDADRRGFDNGYEYKSGGFITGYDRVFGAVTVGGSFAYTAGSYEDKNALASDSDIDSYAFTLYGTYNHCSGFFGTLMAGYTYSDYDMNNFVVGNQWNKADFHANTWTIGGTLGYDFRPTECLTITPSIGLYHYTSASSTFNTTLQNSMKVEQDATELPIDVAVNYDIPTASGKVRLTANTGYAYSFSKDGGELDGFGYNGIANARVEGIKGRENARHTWNIGAGATYSTGRFDVGVKYDYYLKSDYDAHRVMGTVGINF